MNKATASVEGNDLVIRMPLFPPRPSTSGKTLIVATTSGFVETQALVNGKPVSVSVNATIKPN